jgi:hypothetical protein
MRRAGSGRNQSKIRCGKRLDTAYAYSLASARG